MIQPELCLCRRARGLFLEEGVASSVASSTASSVTSSLVGEDSFPAGVVSDVMGMVSGMVGPWIDLSASVERSCLRRWKKRNNYNKILWGRLKRNKIHKFM